VNLIYRCRITWSSFSTCKSCHCTAEGLTFSEPIHKKTSTTLYITCIAGCHYNFIHITRILFNFANDIAGCQYNFIHITRILFNFANDIRPNHGPKWRSHITPQIGVPNWGPKLGSQIGVPNRSPKSGSQIGVPNRGPKSGSQIGVPNRGPKSRSQLIANQGPK
jgi:hypothetical protein